MLSARRKPHRGRERRAALPVAAPRGHRPAPAFPSADRGAGLLRRGPHVVRRAEPALVAPGGFRPGVPAARAAELRVRRATEPLQLRAAAVGLRDSAGRSAAGQVLEVLAGAELLT